MNPQTILVTHNCQTAGLASALRYRLPNCKIIAAALPAESDTEKIQQIKNALPSIDVWITGGLKVLATDTNTSVIDFPEVRFSAFFPDLVYAKVSRTGELTPIHYNSQLLVGAFNSGLTAEQAIALFTSRAYERLGYFDPTSWTDSWATLNKKLCNQGYSSQAVDSLVRRLKRHGVFMHSVNHPQAVVFTLLAELVLSRIENRSFKAESEFPTDDTLVGTIWPVYPEVAEHLGLRSDYRWRFANTDYPNIASYVRFAFAHYQEQAIQPGELQTIGGLPESLIKTVVHEVLHGD